MSGFCGLRDYLLSTNGTGKQDMVHHNRLIKNRAPTENAIVVKGLIKSFKRLKVLDGIDFAVKHGTILALLGPNGAGKNKHCPYTWHASFARRWKGVNQWP